MGPDHTRCIYCVETTLFCITPYGKKVFKNRSPLDALYKITFTYRYIDDVLSINNPDFENYLGRMYPAEREIK